MSILIKTISRALHTKTNFQKLNYLRTCAANVDVNRSFSSETENAVKQNVDSPAEQNLTFPELLRNSKFITMGSPEGKVVRGKIFHVVGDDLYIDFGWKFHCVCTRPNKNGSLYVRGAEVKLLVKSLELSTRFLGSSKDLTILEADCQLLSLIYSPIRQPRTGPQRRRDKIETTESEERPLIVEKSTT